MQARGAKIVVVLVMLQLRIDLSVPPSGALASVLLIVESWLD